VHKNRCVLNFSASIWGCQKSASGRGGGPLTSSRPSNQRRRRPDSRTPCDDGKVRYGNVYLYSAQSTAPKHGSHSFTCKHIPRKRSPDGATADCGHRHLIAAYYAFIDCERVKGWVGLTMLWRHEVAAAGRTEMSVCDCVRSLATSRKKGLQLSL